MSFKPLYTLTKAGCELEGNNASLLEGKRVLEGCDICVTFEHWTGTGGPVGGQWTGSHRSHQAVIGQGLCPPCGHDMWCRKWAAICPPREVQSSKLPPRFLNGATLALHCPLRLTH